MTPPIYASKEGKEEERLGTQQRKHCLKKIFLYIKVPIIGRCLV